MATLEQIHDLLLKVWKYLPVTGAPGSPWTDREKDEVFDRVKIFEAKIQKLRSNQEKLESNLGAQFAELTKLMQEYISLLRSIDTEIAGERLPMIVKLLSTQISVEDLDRILTEYEKLNNGR